MKILKNSILFIFLFFTMTVKAQTVLDFIQMIDTTFKPYQEGEYLANDSLIDIKNGYYQRGFYFEGKPKDKQKILRQVAVFLNNDRTKTIVEAISYYNFVCWTNEIKFYHYNGKTFRFLDNNERFLPSINPEDLLSEKALFIFKKYYQQANQQYYPTLADFIHNAYDNIRYVLPHYDTNIMVHLDFCDYFGVDLSMEILEEDLHIIENGIVPIKLAYNRAQKQFEK